MAFDTDEQGIANKSKICQGIFIACARAIFPHDSITSPMVADFNTTPMTTNEIDPLLWAIVLWQGTGDVVAYFSRCLASFFASNLSAQDYQRTREGEVDSGWINFKDIDTTNRCAAMTSIALSKEGSCFQSLKLFPFAQQERLIAFNLKKVIAPFFCNSSSYFFLQQRASPVIIFPSKASMLLRRVLAAVASARLVSFF